MYLTIFADNVISLLNEKRMTRADLSRMSGVSNSFLADLKEADKRDGAEFNPSLKTMQAIAFALDVPLANLLDPVNLPDKDHAAYFASLSKHKLPSGLIRVIATLPVERIREIEKWELVAKHQIERDKK